MMVAVGTPSGIIKVSTDQFWRALFQAPLVGIAPAAVLALAAILSVVFESGAYMLLAAISVAASTLAMGYVICVVGTLLMLFPLNLLLRTGIALGWPGYIVLGSTAGGLIMLAATMRIESYALTVMGVLCGGATAFAFWWIASRKENPSSAG